MKQENISGNFPENKFICCRYPSLATCTVVFVSFRCQQTQLKLVGFALFVWNTTSVPSKCSWKLQNARQKNASVLPSRNRDSHAEQTFFIPSIFKPNKAVLFSNLQKSWTHLWMGLAQRSVTSSSAVKLGPFFEKQTPRTQSLWISPAYESKGGISPGFVGNLYKYFCELVSCAQTGKVFAVGHVVAIPNRGKWGRIRSRLEHVVDAQLEKTARWRPLQSEWTKFHQKRTETLVFKAEDAVNTPPLPRCQVAASAIKVNQVERNQKFCWQNSKAPNHKEFFSGVCTTSSRVVFCGRGRPVVAAGVTATY